MYAIVMLLSIASKAYFTLHSADNFFIINCHTFSKMDVIAIGGLLACTYHERQFKFRYSPRYLILILVVMILIMATTNLFDYTTLYRTLFIKYLINIPFIIFFCLFIFNENELVIKWRSNRMFDYIGSISFGIYMFHFIVIFFLQKIIPVESIFQKIIFLFITSIASIGVAALIFKYFETPFLRMKRKFEKKKQNRKSIHHIGRQHINLQWRCGFFCRNAFFFWL
ncbi:MAG: acyltransferase family protein [Chitinophagales bacterium]|nr:acyltransferase family protein [Chitinophagales bacterium]